MKFKIKNLHPKKSLKMHSIFRFTFISILLTLFLSPIINAQPKTGNYFDASIGLGLSAPYDEVDVSSSGFYAQGEYVFGISKWFGLRPYAGVIITSPDENPNLPDYYKVTGNGFLFGGKARVAAPIPWVAPYFEVGLGGSIGSFETYTPFTNIKKNGLLMHIPFSLGLALGRKHNFEFEFTYYYHQSVEQFCGAVAIGYSFPIRKK